MHAASTAFLCIILLSPYAAPLRADSGPDPTRGWNIQAQQAAWASDGNPVITGGFRITSPPQSADADPATPQGGACLVANLVPYGIGRPTCASHADCNGPDAIDRQRDPRLADYTGYCARRDGSAEAPTCWTRPGPAESYCKRTIDGWKMAAGEHEIGPVNGDPLGAGKPYPEWAVYACMAYFGNDRACGMPANDQRRISLTPSSSRE